MGNSMRVDIKQRMGFSLVEVNLAIFVISVGMLTLFSLFPAGLRQVATSHEATQEALFADYVLSTMRAEARLMPADDWLDFSIFRDRVLGDLDLQESSGGAVERTPFGAIDQYMRYVIEIREVSGRPGRRSVTLWCKAQEFGPTGDTFKRDASRFYTEFVYSGMP